MKTLKKSIVTAFIVVSAGFLISWTFFFQVKKNSVYHSSSFTAAAYDDIAFDTSVPGFYSKKPLVEDVYVQKIKDDPDHLLIIAKVSSAESAIKFFEIESDDRRLIFRDDGKGYDAAGGDGYYTAPVQTNVRGFRTAAASLASVANPPRFRFDGREIVKRNADKSSLQFDAVGFDNSRMIPITDLGITSATPGLIDHSLIVTNLDVVEDSTRTWNPCTQKGNVDGPWTFKTIMKQLASVDTAHLATDEQLSTFVLNWLHTWLNMQVINGDTVNARTRMTNKIIQPWLDKSFEAGAPAGQLDMRFAPFKLLAIINRVDLRSRQNGVSNIGEGRLIFGLINSTCTNKEEFTVIFEYGIPLTKCAAKLNYVSEWFNLKDLVLGSSAYNAALQHITDQFTLCGTNTKKANQSSLNQVRTNEVAIAPVDDTRWELREFILDSTTHQLKPTTLKKEPAKKYNARVDNPDVQRMANFVNNSLNRFGQPTFIYPDSLEGFPFVAGASIIDNPPTGDSIPKVYHWDGTDKTIPASFITGTVKRQSFSVNTCSGCHAGETQTAFTHVDPVFFGKEATLSGFLSGKAGRNNAFDFDGDPDNGIMTVKDPAGRPPRNPTLRGFNDLERRATDLQTLATTTCGSVLQIRNSLLFQPLGMTH